MTVRETKMSSAALIDAATEPGVGFAADGDGGFILPGFLPAFDAAAALRQDARPAGPRASAALAMCATRLPQVHLAHETVVTPWDQKGLVMRVAGRAWPAASSCSSTASRRSTTTDGSLALPDPEEPVTHVWAEAGSDSEARRLAQEYVRRIRQLVR